MTFPPRHERTAERARLTRFLTSAVDDARGYDEGGDHPRRDQENVGHVATFHVGC
jgi:hypothetical protein